MAALPLTPSLLVLGPIASAGAVEPASALQFDDQRSFELITDRHLLPRGAVGLGRAGVPLGVVADPDKPGLAREIGHQTIGIPVLVLAVAEEIVDCLGHRVGERAAHLDSKLAPK